MDYQPDAGAYRNMARSGVDVANEDGDTEVWFSGQDGRLLRFHPPLGHTRADADDAWLDDLHQTEMFDLPYRVFVSAFGLLVSGLTVTGVLIWTKKRLARLAKASRGRQTPVRPDTDRDLQRSLCGVLDTSQRCEGQRE